MPFKIVSVRSLERKETELYKEAADLLAKGYDRRELAKLLGLTGALLFAPVISIRPAHAFVPAALTGLYIIGGAVVRGALIAASMTISNATAQTLTGLIGVKHIEPSGNIAGTDSASVQIPARSQVKVTHKGFRAKTEGQNSYEAQSALNQLEDTFQVVPA